MSFWEIMNITTSTKNHYRNRLQFLCHNLS